MRRKHKLKIKSALSLFLVAALLLAMLPALPVSAADTDVEIYTQSLQGITTYEAKAAGDQASLVSVNQSSGLLSGNVLQINNTGAEVRVKLKDFGGTPENEGLADGIYEITFSTGDKLYGSLGFLVRYKDEFNYTGLTIDNTTNQNVYTWKSQYSIPANGRNNDLSFTQPAEQLQPNTSYKVEITYKGADVSLKYLKEGDADYTDLGTVTMTAAGYYTGPGGLAIRLNPGSGSGAGGSLVTIDNIVQKELNGEVVKAIDFDSDSTIPAYEIYTNKGTTSNPNLAALSLKSVDKVLAGFGNGENAHQLNSVSGGLFIDNASPETDNGIYSVKINGSTNEYGLVFNYKDENNYAAIQYTDSGWIAGGKKDGNPVSVDLSSQIGHASVAEAIYSLSLKYEGNQIDELIIDDVAYTIGQLTDLYSGKGKVGIAAGANTSLYTGAITLAYTVTAEIPGVDPSTGVGGLPPVAAGAGQDNYNQNLIGNVSSIKDPNGNNVSAVNVNQVNWGMDGNAMGLIGNDDYRIKLLPFGGDTADHAGPANGSYEISFRIGDAVPTSLGFLARYLDEENYAGLSIDLGKWSGHYSTGTARQNPSVNTDPEHMLQANTSYKLKMTYQDTRLTFDYMKEGDTKYTNLGSYTLNSSGYTGAGGFAIRTRTGGQMITLDNIIQYDASGNRLVSLDFNDGVLPAYEARVNRGTTINNSAAALSLIEIPVSETVDGFPPSRASKLEAPGAGLYIDSASPQAAGGIYTVQLNGSKTNYGIVFNYADDNNYATIQYDGSKWIAGGMNNGKEVSMDLSIHNIPAPVAGETRALRLDSSDSANIKLIRSGEASDDYQTYNLGELTGIYDGQGQVGLITGEAMTLLAGAIHVVYDLVAVNVPDPEAGTYITLQSDQMKVLVGNEFPHIYTYKDMANNTIANGVRPGAENAGMSIVTELGQPAVDSTTTSKLKSSTENSATYEITATGSGVEATFTVVLTVEGKTLTMEIPAVVQTTGKVRTFSFSDQKMVSFAGLGAGAAMGRVNGWGPASDVFVELKGAAQNTTHANVTYVLLYDKASRNVAAIENNAENGANKYLLSQNVGAGTDAYLAVANSAWAWQYYDAINPEGEEKPYSKIIIGGDENHDGDITWQDAGISYREIMREPYGSENTKNEWMYIAMNMSSQTSQPFVRVLDQAKAISYLTDGFGMKIMNKGYQAGGHDDSHGDYKFVGIQQGGVKDFNYLIDEGLKYGIKNGVHLNATEFALDGFTTELDNMVLVDGNLRKNWNWFDQAYLVDKTKDVTSGALKKRLDDFEHVAPNLDFVYVDVYQSGSRYNASQLIKYMNTNGITVGTEALGDFNQDITFVHWNTDLYYAVGGTQSQVMRFVMNGLGDLGAPDRALLGALMPGVADWRNTNTFSDAQTTFYRNNLPTKYLQHFDLLSWEPGIAAAFSDNVSTVVKKEGGRDYLTITKDGKAVARIDVTSVRLFESYSSGGNPVRPTSAEIFIPWSPETEDKIYVYNDVNATKTWEVPDSWGLNGNAYLYRLTNSGRAEETLVSYTDGKVNLNIDLSTPYILTKNQGDQPHLYNTDGTAKSDLLPAPTGDHAWGEGGLIQNIGFTDLSLDGWDVTATEGKIDDVAVDLTFPGADPRVSIAGTFNGSMSQEIDVESGKTYSFSVWAMSQGMRPIKLSATAGDVTVESSVDTTLGIPIKIRPSKYTNMDYQRLKVDITIPEGVDTATLSFSTVTGDLPVYLDDFRSWEWPGTPNPLKDEYYYYEDFENLDENWGPFISQVGGQPYIHLAYKNPQGGQIKYYTVDTLDNNGNPDAKNLTSLKSQQFGSFGTIGSDSGIMMRTLPSTLNFEKGKNYRVEFDYQTYRELREEEKGVKVGYNYPLTSAVYYVDVRSADGSLIETYPLQPSTFAESATGNYSYNSRPSTELMSFPVNAVNEAGIFLSFRADTDKVDNSAIMAIDNFRVIDTDNDNQLITAVKLLLEQSRYTVAQSDVESEADAKAKAQALVNSLAASGVAAQVNTVSYTEAEAGTSANVNGTNGEYVFTVDLTKGDESVTTAELTMTITASGYVRPDEPSNPGTGNPGEPSTNPDSNPDDSKTVVTEHEDGSKTSETTTNNGTVITTETPADKKAASTVTAAVKTMVKDGALAAELPAADIDALIKAVKDSGVKTITIKSSVTDETDVTKTSVVIPASAAKELSKVVDVAVETPLGTVTLAVSALKGLTNGAADISINLETNADHTYTIEIKSGEQVVKQVTGGVKVELAANKPNSGTVAMAVLPDGTKRIIRKSAIVNGSLRALLDGSATIVLVDNAKSFIDMPASNWAAGGVDFVSSRDLFKGVDDHKFAPNAVMNRAMMVTVLNRLEGEIKADAPSNFPDVNSGAYYADSVDWAAEKGIVLGTGAGFNPQGEITRESLAVMLYRYANVLGYDTSARGAMTGEGTSSWAKDAMSWAVGAGLMEGDQNGQLKPHDHATRAEVAVLLERFVTFIVK